jgi:DnaD/phage-associated family protein
MTNSTLSGLAERSFFFARVMPQIEDVAELKVLLSIFYLLYHKPEYPRFVTYSELLSNSALVAEMGEQTLRRALDSAVEHGAISRSILKLDGSSQDAYSANTESDKKAIRKVRQGRLPIQEPLPGKAASSPNIFSLYEENIGMLTPMIAEELREAEELYPSQWIQDAFKESVALNKRNWRYVARILERWAIEGKDSGENRQSAKKGGPNKYVRGKYGHLVKR